MYENVCVCVRAITNFINKLGNKIYSTCMTKQKYKRIFYILVFVNA